MMVNGAILSSPKKGSRYCTCHLVTSPVVDFKPFKNGWEVQTENSLYQFFITDMEEIERLVKENNFTGPRRLGSEAMYWD